MYMGNVDNIFQKRRNDRVIEPHSIHSFATSRMLVMATPRTREWHMGNRQLGGLDGWLSKAAHAIRNVTEKVYAAPLSIVAPKVAKKIVAKDVRIVRFNDVRDTLQSAGAIAGDYFAPGSSFLTSKLVSKGSQKQLASPVGLIAQVGASAAGAYKLITSQLAAHALKTVTPALSVAAPSVAPAASTFTTITTGVSEATGGLVSAGQVATGIESGAAGLIKSSLGNDNAPAMQTDATGAIAADATAQKPPVDAKGLLAIGVPIALMLLNR